MLLRWNPIRLFHWLCLELLAGVMLGFIAAICLGWITFGGGTEETRRITVQEPVVVPQDGPVDANPPVDQDGDGIPDSWETIHRLDPANPDDAESDFDLDGLTALEEYLHGKNPLGGWDTKNYPVPTAVSGWSAYVTAVNRNGVVLVNFYTYTGGADVYRCYLLDTATSAWSMVTPAVSEQYSWGNDLNDKGDVAFEFWSSDWTTGYGLIRHANGSTTELVDDLDRPVAAFRINNTGDWVGYVLPTYEVVASVDGEIASPDPGWSSWSYNDVNDWGEILGSYLMPGFSGMRAFIQNGPEAFFATGLPGDYPFFSGSPDVNSGVAEMNNYGEFVGRAQLVGPPYTTMSYLYDGSFRNWKIDGQPLTGSVMDIDDLARVTLQPTITGPYSSGILCSDGIAVPVSTLSGITGSNYSTAVMSGNGTLAFCLNGVAASIHVVKPDQDQDEDGMPDDWEDVNGLNKNSAEDASVDSDDDGKSNLGEYLIGSNPHADPAFDEDGEAIDLRPGIDTDGDGIPNVWEWNNGLNYLDPADAPLDFDRDGHSNLQEFRLKTEPRGLPTYQVREAGPFPGASVSWTSAGFGGDGISDAMYMLATPPVPATDGGTRPAVWSVPVTGESGSFSIYPSHGSQTTTVLTRTVTGAIAATHSSNPTTLVFWSSPTSNPVSIPGTNGSGGSNTRSISPGSKLSPSAKYLAGRRVNHQSGDLSHFIWRMPDPGQPFTTLPVTLVIPGGTTLSPSASLHVNDHGYVAATVTVVGVNRVMLWKISADGLSTTATLQPNHPGGTNSSVIGISNSATPIIVGNGNKTTSGAPTALGWSPSGVVSELTIPGGTFSSVTAISPGGLVSGSSMVVPEGGGIVKPRTFLASYQAVSSQWKIVPQGSWVHSFSHRSVTDAGEILGSASFISGTVSVPVIWRHGTLHMVKLPPSSGYNLVDISAINGNGALSATAVRDGVSTRVILSPDSDTDSDGMTDRYENSRGLSAYRQEDALLDPDNDGLSNREEFEHNTEPDDPDTDGDGMNDGWEIEWGLMPHDPGDAGLDPDEDRVPNSFEFKLGTPPTGLYRVDTTPLNGSEYLSSVGPDGSLFIYGPSSITDMSGNTIGTGWSGDWLGPWVQGGTRPRVDVPFGGWNDYSVPGESHYYSGYFNPAAGGKVNGFLISSINSDPGGALLDSDTHLFRFDALGDDDEVLSWKNDIAPSRIPGGWTGEANFGAASPQGLRRIAQSSTRRVVISDAGYGISELPYAPPLSIGAEFTSINWQSINDGGNAAGVAMPGSVPVSWNGSELKKIGKPAEWGSDAMGFARTYDCLTNDGYALMQRTVAEPIGTSRQDYYLMDLYSGNFAAVERPGLGTGELLLYLAEGGKMIGSGVKPWLHNNGTTLLLEGLMIDSGNPAIPNKRVRDMGWGAISPVHITKKGDITLTISPGAAVLQLHPLRDQDGDEMPDDWEKYWAKFLSHAIVNPDPDIQDDLATGNLDPNIDYLGDGGRALDNFMSAEEEEEEEEEDPVFCVEQERTAQGIFQTLTNGKIFAEMFFYGYPVDPSSYWIYATSEIQPADATVPAVMDLLEDYYPWNDFGITRSPEPTDNLLGVHMYGSHRLSSPTGAGVREFSFTQERFFLGRTDPIVNPTVRTFVETRKFLDHDDPIAHPTKKWQIVNVDDLEVPANSTWSNSSFAFETVPGANDAIAMNLDMLQPKIEVLSPDLPITRPEGPPTHRKISLFATPIKDGAPQQVAESDTPQEEVYVDAWDRSLNFRTSFAWFPQGSSELPLGVTVSYNPTALTVVETQTFDPKTGKPNGTRQMLSPNAELMSGGFGVGFSSNLSGGIRVKAEISTQEDKQTGQQTSKIDRYNVDVVDSDGVPYKFTSLNLGGFQKEAGPVSAAPAQQVTLAWTDGNRTHLVLTQKYGKKCIYKWSSGAVVLPGPGMNSGVGGGISDLSGVTLQGSAYLDRVEDRFGNRVVYTSGSIAHYHAGSGVPSGVISFERNSQGLISKITDPRGKSTRFTYLTQVVGRGDIKLPVLSKVILPDGGVREFGIGIDFRKPKQQSTYLPPPTDPTDPFAYAQPRPKKKKRWTTGDFSEAALAPYLYVIKDPSGRVTSFKYDEPLEIDSAQQIRINATLNLEKYEDMEGNDMLTQSVIDKVIANAKMEISPDIVDEMAMKGYFKVPTSSMQPVDPDDPFNNDPYNDDPYVNAEGIYFRSGLTSAPAVEQVTSSDINGDGTPEVIKIGLEDNFLKYITQANPGSPAGTWGEGLPSSAAAAAQRPQLDVRKTTVSDGIGDSVYRFGDAMIVSYANQAAQEMPGAPPRVQPQMEEIPPGAYTAAIVVRKLAIERGGANETFYFNPFAGMALAGAIDASGNMIYYGYTDVFPQVAGGPKMSLGGMPMGPGITQLQQFHSDPTSETRVKGNILTGIDSSQAPVTRSYQYSGTLRQQTRIVDERGYITKQGLNANQQRIWEKVYENSSAESSDKPLRWETFTYGNISFPMFVTEHRIKKIDDPDDSYMDPPWVADRVTTFDPDTKGRIWKENVQAGGGVILTTTHTYDENGNKKTITTPRGLTTTFTYDDLNRITVITYHDGTVKQLQYDKAGRKTVEIDENGNRSSFKYSPGGFLLEARRHMTAVNTPAAADIVTRTSYDSRGRVVALTDGMGNVTRTSYDSLDRPVLVTDAMGNQSAFDYDLTKNAGGGIFNASSFKPTRTRDARGYVTEVTFNHRYLPERVSKEYTKPAGTLGDWKTRALGSVGETDTVYDAAGNPTHTYVKRVAGAGLGSTDVKFTLTAYDPLGRANFTNVEHGDSMAHTSRVEFTSTGFAWRTTEFENVAALKRHFEREYDGAGRVIKEWSPAGLTGNINKPTGPTHVSAFYSALVSTAYDADGNVSQVTDALGRVTNYHYDNRNRRWKEELPSVAVYGGSPARPTTITTYDNVGNVDTVQDPRGYLIKTNFDRANRAWKAFAAFGTTEQTATETQYDKNGNITVIIDQNGNITRNSYDPLNRLIGTSVNPATGNPGWPTNPLAGDVVVANVHDPVGNLLLVADGAATKTWTTAGWTFPNQTSEGHVTEFRYDGLNRKTHTIWDAGTSLAKTELSEYDAVAMTRRVDAAGRETLYSYDSLFRLTTTSYTGAPQENHTRYYKGASSTITTSGPGPQRAVWYGNGTDIRDVTYTVNRLHQTTAETSGNANHIYLFDIAGNRILSRYYGKAGQELRSVVTEYDALNRAKFIHETTRASVVVLPSFTVNPATDKTTAYAYDIGGNTRSKLLPNGQLTITDYDAHGRKRLINTTNQNTLATISRFDYRDDPNPLIPRGYDAAGNMTRVVETYSNFSTRTVVNDYDRFSRLVRENTSDSAGTVETEYEYDAASNRTVKDVAGGSTPGTWLFTYGNISNGKNTNQLASYNRPSDGANFTFTYDPLGNRWKRHKNTVLDTTYTYDRENRLLKFDSDDSAGRDDDYVYDYRSRRVVRDESGAANGQGMNVQLSFSGGTSVQEYVPGQTAPAAEHIRGTDWGGGVGGILYSLRAGAASFCSYNSRGDVVSRTDTSGTVTWQATYEAFGTRTQNFGSTTERQTANTKDEDLSGLLNEGMRYRDLEAGVFLTRDPAGFVDGPNVYTYVKQNPWSSFDPLGLWGWKALASMVLDCVPVVSTIKSAVELVAGRDVITGEPINRAEAAVSLAASFSPGGKMAVKAAIKGAKLAEKAMDAVDKVETAIAVAEAAATGDIATIAEVAAEAAVSKVGHKKKGEGGDPAGSSQREQKADNSTTCDGEGRCFIAGTMVHTPEGLTPIEEIEAGDKVLSYNLDTKEWETGEVAVSFSNTFEGELVVVNYEGGSVTATDTHPFWVISGEDLMNRPVEEEIGWEHWGQGGRWVRADDLKPGDVLMMQESGKTTRIVSLDFRKTNVLVYNFEVRGLHNYTVGDGGVLVHNTNCGGDKTRWNSTDRSNGWKAKGYADGKGPQREVIVRNRKTGEIETRVETKELHHIKPRHEGGGNEDENLAEVWPDEHEKIDKHRHLDYDVIEEIPDHAYSDRDSDDDDGARKEEEEWEEEYEESNS